MSQTRKIRWLLDHEPVELFIRTAQAFNDQIKALTNGAFEVEMYTRDEYIAKRAAEEQNNRGVEFYDVLNFMQAGDIEMTQLHVQTLGSWYCPDFFALELPFLFDTHEHATRVLDGAIGKQLLDKLAKDSPATGLAFTYSGGYRVFASTTPVNTVEDFAGLTCLTGVNPVLVDTAKAFGLTPTPVFFAAKTRSEEEMKELYSKNNVLETTLPRYEAEAYKQGQTYIADSAHSMYLTSIIVNNEFFATLTPAEQSAFREAAKNVAKLEREWSVDDAVTIAGDTDKHTRMGITYTQLPEEEKNKLRRAAIKVQDKYKTIFSSGLVDSIKNT